jgi:hydrogenase-4 component E
MALIITSFGAVVTRNLRYATYIYALHALIWTTIISLFATAAPTLFIWAAVAFITKIIIITWDFLSFVKGKPEYEVKAIIGFTPSVIIVTLLVIIVFEITHKYVHFLAPTTIAAEEPYRTNLAVSFIVFVLGLYGILTRRDAFKTAIALCLLENGAHLSLISLAPGLKETVIIGIVTDVVMVVNPLMFTIKGLREVAGTTDTYQLTELHW